MKNFSRKQIIAPNKIQLPIPSRIGQEIPIEEQIQAHLNQEGQNNSKYDSESKITKAKLNLKKDTIIDESIYKLTCAIKLLSNKINVISEHSNQQLTSAVNLLSDKINKISEQSGNRIEQRFKPVNVQLVKLIKVEKEQGKGRRDEQEKKQTIKKKKQRKRMINNWLGKLCNQVFSVGFLLYKKDELKLKDVKAFCSENVLRNIINLSEQNELTKEDFENIDKCLTKDLLLYFKSKYPQTLQSQVNMALSKKIVPIDNMQSNDYDLVYKSGIQFKITKDGNYNSDIMEFTNYVVKVPQRSIKREQGKMKDSLKFFFDSYYDKMNKFMMFICTRPQDRSEQVKMNENQQNREAEINKQIDKEEKQKKKEYEDKVRSYSNFEIGQKLSKNFQLFSKVEIDEQIMKFRSSAHIRVLTKWCQQLQNNFDQDYIMKRQIPFRMKDGTQSYLSNKRLTFLCALLAYQKSEVTKRLDEIKENNHEFQSKFSQMSIHQNLQIFLKEEALIGQFSAGVYKAYENYLINYLNILIHSINIALKNFMNILIYYSNLGNPEDYFIHVITIISDKNKFRNQMHWFEEQNSKGNSMKREKAKKQIFQVTPQLISFSLGDLVRCRYTSKEDEILTLYEKLHTDPDIKIVRVKNRLDGGNRDILMNALFKNEIITQIQLCIKSEKSRYIECSNQFNHFFYQLKRAQFGPICEMVNLWINYDKRSQQYMQRIDDIFGAKIKNNSNYEVVKQKNKFCCQNTAKKKISLPFQCSYCESHYFDVYESDGNKYCQECDKFLCVNCELNLDEIIKALPIKDKQKIKKIVVAKEQILFVKNCSDESNFVLLNLKSKHRKIRPFKIIQESNKIHLFEKRDNPNQFNLIKTFKINEDYENEIQMFLDKNLIIEVYGVKQLVPPFDFRETLENYFFPKLFKQTQRKQKDSIFMRGSKLKENNIPTDIVFDKLKSIDFGQNELKSAQFILKTFPNIEYANLIKNEIDSISKDIFELPKLNVLNLQSNLLTKLPQKVKASELQYLHLNSNRIEEIPQQFFSFVKLRALELQSNMIRILPRNKPNLDSLQQLSLAFNQISEIPNDFFNFKKLKILKLGQNKIKMLPQYKPNMDSLESLFLQHNQIQEIPNDFFNFNELKILNLSNNKILKVPQIKPNLQNLEELHLWNNKIEEIPDEFLNFDKLRILYLSQNKLTRLPQKKLNLNCLEQLYLHGNQISQIPDNFLNFEKLRFLTLYRNKINKLPTGKPNMNNLQQLYMFSNHIQEIPYQFFSFSKLRVFDMSTNQIKAIPRSISNLNSLERIYLNNNEIEQIPEEMFNLYDLKILEISNNKINKVPQNKPNLNNLEELQLSQNQIEELSDEFYNFDRLRKLSLDENKIKKLPKNGANMKNLIELFLKKNQISVISSQFIFDKLAILDLKDNPIVKIEYTIISPNLKEMSISSQYKNKLDQVSKINFQNMTRHVKLFSY